MDEHAISILKDSDRIISKLQLLAVFFGDEAVYQIYIRTQVIHKLFEQHQELDIHKLELFHLQYTSSVIELLKKIKKANERTVGLLHEELALNKDLIRKIDDNILTQQELQAEQHKQVNKLSISFRKLYRVLSEDSKEYPFSSNIHQFSEKFGTAYFHEITEEQCSQLMKYQATDVYTNPYVIIQRKLLGLLSKHDFNIEFKLGLKAKTVLFEAYSIPSAGRYFIFRPQDDLFLLCDEDLISLLNIPAEPAKGEKILISLSEKNTRLESEALSSKTRIPAEVKTLLIDYNQKIAGNNFLEELIRFDVQANILRAMLRTNDI